MKISLYIIALIVRGCLDRTHNVTCRVWINYFCAWCARFASAQLWWAISYFFMYIVNAWSHDFSRAIWNKWALGTCKLFQRPQIALEIMWLPILIMHMKKLSASDWLKMSTKLQRECKLQKARALPKFTSVLTFCDVFSCTLVASNNMISRAIWCNKHL